MSSNDNSVIQAVQGKATNTPVATDTNSQVIGANSKSNDAELKNAKLSTMEEVKEKSPKLYNMMMQGIASDICNRIKDSQERLKKMMQEARQNASG